MTNDAVPRPLNWKELYPLAMLELDARKLPSLVDQANSRTIDPHGQTDPELFLFATAGGYPPVEVKT